MKPIQHKIMTAQLVTLLILIGFAAGVLSGLVGVGGGIIIVPALVFFLGFSQQAAQGTSLGLLLLPVGILAVMSYYNKGYIDVKIVAIMSVAFIFGGWAGGRLAMQLSQEMLRKIFAIVLFYTAFRMLHWDTYIIKWVKNLF